MEEGGTTRNLNFIYIFSCDSSSIPGNVGRSVGLSVGRSVCRSVCRNEFQGVQNALKVPGMIMFQCIMPYE